MTTMTPTSPDAARPASSGPLASRVSDYQQRIEDVLARALDIVGGATPRLLEAMRYSTLAGGGYALCQGTSFSAPFVAGAAALVRARYPNLTAREVIQVLASTSDDINVANPRFGGGLTFGRLNAFRAVGGDPGTPDDRRLGADAVSPRRPSRAVQP